MTTYLRTVTASAHPGPLGLSKGLGQTLFSTAKLISGLRIPEVVDAYQAIKTKLDIREFSGMNVDDSIKTQILQAARLTGSSMNSQHWRFVIVQDQHNLTKLASDSTTGSWVSKAAFAIIINIDPKIPGSTIDVGRVLQDMQLAAWALGVASGLYTGLKEVDMRHDFGIPQELKPAAVLGFGYAAKSIKGKKNRKPLEELVYAESFGKRFQPSTKSPDRQNS